MKNELKEIETGSLAAVISLYYLLQPLNEGALMS